METIITFIVAYLDIKSGIANDISKNKKYEYVIRNCYKTALDKWCLGNEWRKRISSHRFADIESLLKYLIDNKCNFDFSLLNFFACELSKSKLIYDFASNLDYTVADGDCNGVMLFDSIINSRNSFRLGESSDITIRKGLTRHGPIKDYIRRYCSLEQKEDFSFYFDENINRFTLSDYVTDIAASNHKKYILYSGAQTGKTTELKNLCWELQESGAFLPISFEVKSSYDLKAEQLPRTRYIGNKEIVVIIDALDEINGPEREKLILAIKSYSHDNPDVRMVLSCRSNYRRNDIFKEFKELFLLGLSDYDIRQYVNDILGDSEFIPQVHSSGMNEFLKHPFFLNILIDAYRTKRQLPTTRAEIYQLFIDKSYETECSKDQESLKITRSVSQSESLALLKRVALSMSLMSRQSLNDNDMLKCLYNDSKNIELCKRFGILNYEDKCYSFTHNAVREWLVACYLYEYGLEKARSLSSYPNGMIKPDWHNIIILWISMYGKDDSDKVAEILKWLENTSLELIIHADSDTLDLTTRENIFKGIVLQYKELGIRMGGLMSDEYTKLVSFCQSPSVMDFITQELEDSQIGTVYYSDLMGICSKVDWIKLKFQDRNIFDKLLSAIDNKLIEKKELEPNGDISYFVIENDFFANSVYLEKYYSLFSNSNNYEVIKCLMTLIAKVKCGDKYIDYILEKEQYVNDQHKNNCTTCVSRFEVYYSLSTVKSYDGIKKLLSHKFTDDFSYHSFEWSYYTRMMENCLSYATRYIKDGHTDLIPLIKQNYLYLFDPERNYYSADCDKKSLQESFRQLFKNTRLDVEERQNFKLRLLALLNDKPSYEQIHSEYVLATLWMKAQDIEEYYYTLNASDSSEISFVRLLECCPDEEIKRIAQEKDTLLLPEPDGIKTMRLRREKYLRDFADYNVFKSLVVDFTDKHSKKVKPYKMDGLDEEFNEYVVRFCSHFVNDADLYITEDIIEAINDKYSYDSFFMSIIKNGTLSLGKRERMPEDYKRRCIETAKETITRLVQAEDVCCWKDAIKVLLSERFHMPVETLVKLLPYSSISISITEAGNFGHTYSLFDHITENVAVTDLANPLVEYITKNPKWLDNNIYDFACYIINHKIVKGYDVLLEYISSERVHATSIADIFIENGIHVDSIKCISDKTTIDSKLSIYSSLLRHGIDEKWIVSKLEPAFKDFSGSHLTLALKLLLSAGSMEALSYIVTNIDKLDYRNGFIYNYSNSNAVYMLVSILEHFYSKDDTDYLNVNSIFSSLERIALQGREQLNTVKSSLMSLISKNVNLKFINRYIITFEQKYYESNIGILNVDDVIAIIDCEINNKQQKNDTYTIYVSYNWEDRSNRTVDHLCYVLENNGIKCRRDKTDCNYIDNIKEFMMALQESQFIVVVLSKPYLESKNCMFEFTGIMQHGDYQNRILPIVVDDTIRDRHYYVELCKHWNTKKELISSEVAELEFNKTLTQPLEEELNVINTILASLPQIKTYIDWTNASSLSILTSTHFKSLIDTIKTSIKNHEPK